MKHPRSPATSLYGVTLALLLSLSTAHTGAQQTSGKPPLHGDVLAVLARSLLDADALQQWDFADALLGVLQETYDDELDRAGEERPSDPARQAKLWRWRRATGQVAGQLRSARLRLGEGAALQLHVDPQDQVFLFIDGEPLAFSVPRPGTGTMIGQRVVDRYCAVNDCSQLGAMTDAPPRPLLPAGAWAIRPHGRPAYEIGDRVRCEFGDLESRSAKVTLCRTLAGEALGLLATLHSAIDERDIPIDWSALHLAGHPTDRVQRLVIDAQGRALSVQAPALTRLDPADRVALHRWLRHSADGSTAPLELIVVDGLLP